MTTKSKWTIDLQHSEISFKVRHLMISNVRGRFKEFDADIQVYNDDFSTSEIDLWINAASISTDDDKRDEHLRSADFFDTESFKEISFISTAMEKTSKENVFNLVGELTIKGITQPVNIEVEFGGIMTDPWGNEKAGFTIHGKVNRKDWGQNWNTALDNGGFLVGDEVSIHCEIQLIKVKKSPKAMKLEATETQEEPLGSINI